MRDKTVNNREPHLDYCGIDRLKNPVPSLLDFLHAENTSDIRCDRTTGSDRGRLQ